MPTKLNDKIKARFKEEFTPHLSGVLKGEKIVYPEYHPLTIENVLSFLDSAIAEVKQAALDALPEEENLPKSKCINAESHLFGFCLECEKTKARNSALTQSRENIEKI